MREDGRPGRNRTFIGGFGDRSPTIKRQAYMHLLMRPDLTLPMSWSSMTTWSQSWQSELGAL